MFSKILLATDGSNHANNALKIAIDLALKYDSELTIVHVLTHDHPSEEMERMIEVEHLNQGFTPTHIHDDVNRIADTLAKRSLLRSGDQEVRVITVIGEQILKAANNKARDAGLKNVRTEIHSGDYANAILHVAEKEQSDMIIMGRRGLSRLRGFVTGSVSHKVAQRASCSVLTVK
jgi:nucleotide-binding universal stress UspA family protein